MSIAPTSESSRAELPDTRTGRVVAVGLSATRAFPKFPQERVVVGPYGIVGDVHAEPQRSEASPGALACSDRAISVVADEVRREMNALLGRDLQAGDFNENVLVAGLGDLGDLVAGDRLAFSGGVELQVTGQNPPCELFEEYGGPGLIKATAFKDENGAIHNRHGVMTRVARTGEVRPGDTVTLRREAR